MKEKDVELTNQDYQNLIALINKTPISGSDAETVSILKYKLNCKLKPVEDKAKKDK